MKKILVIGLGIIGGSIAAALTSAGYEVDGLSRSESSVNYALNAGYIRRKAENIATYDVVFIAVPPRVTVQYLDEGIYKDGALVTDICGIKSKLEEVVYSKPRNYRYVGIHPMAGKETSGIASATPDLFQNANLVIARAAHTAQSDVDEIREYATAMRFGRIVECSAKHHDEKIALTSQLAHIVSNAYVKSAHVRDCDGFTGGSFQDMTRIAGVDEKMWMQLYMYNREYIVAELERLISDLKVYKNAIENEDEEALVEALKEGRLIRENIKRPND